MTIPNVSYLVWVDLEMTGLDPVKNKILEIACIITTQDLEIVAQSPVIAIHHDVAKLVCMDTWCTEMHKKSGLLDAVAASKFSLQQAEAEILTFVKQHCYEKKSPLCGNSVWMDRFFMRFHMPTLYDFLHYRTIDVSSIKELIKRWYPGDPQSSFKKENAHRALGDIVESIEELKHYKRHFFKTSSMF